MKSNYLSYILVAVLAIIVFHAFTKRTPKQNEVIKETVTVDTVRYIQTDTIFRYEPKYITQTLIKHDTLYFTKDSIVYLPITQKHYNEPDLYDVWVSGYEAKMDSIKTYNKTEYKTIEKVITREKVVNKYELYLNGGLNAFSGTFIPKVGVSLITPKKMLYNANLGLYNGKVTYEIGVGIKLF
jgi:hypothetical protein